MTTSFREEKIKLLFSTTPFDKSDLERLFDVFGDLIDIAVMKTMQLGISVDFLIDQIDLIIETYDLPKDWNKRPDRKSYADSIFNIIEKRVKG